MMNLEIKETGRATQVNTHKIKQDVFRLQGRFRIWSVYYFV